MSYKLILILSCYLISTECASLDCKFKRSSFSNDNLTGVSCNFTSNANAFNEATTKPDVTTPPTLLQTATAMKNIIKGPADLGIYYINSPGLSCGGLKTAQCSTSCGALGYPVYWCYPKVCYCHYGSKDTNEIEDDFVLPTPST